MVADMVRTLMTLCCGKAPFTRSSTSLFWKPNAFKPFGTIAEMSTVDKIAGDKLEKYPSACA